MNKQEKELQEILVEQEIERAKNRVEFLGVHHYPVKKVRSHITQKPMGKSSRIKTFKFKVELQSWKDFLNNQISFDQLKSLQGAYK